MAGSTAQAIVIILWRQVSKIWAQRKRKTVIRSTAYIGRRVSLRAFNLFRTLRVSTLHSAEYQIRTVWNRVERTMSLNFFGVAFDAYTCANN